jgi:hypothetical protein
MGEGWGGGEWSLLEMAKGWLRTLVEVEVEVDVGCDVGLSGLTTAQDTVLSPMMVVLMRTEGMEEGTVSSLSRGAGDASRLTRVARVDGAV